MNKALFIIMLLCIPISYALECQPETQLEYIPCQVTTTWYYPEYCDKYNVSIYNDTSLIYTVNLTKKGESGLCNFTFNMSLAGSYYYNISIGDTGQISVMEDDKMISESISGFYPLALFMGLFGLGLVVFITSIVFSYFRDYGSSMVFGIIGATLFIILGVSVLMGYEILPNTTSLINTSLAMLCILLGVFSSYYSYLNKLHKDDNKAKRQIQESYGIYS